MGIIYIHSIFSRISPYYSKINLNLSLETAYFDIKFFSSLFDVKRLNVGIGSIYLLRNKKGIHPRPILKVDNAIKVKKLNFKVIVKICPLMSLKGP